MFPTMRKVVMMERPRLLSGNFHSSQSCELRHLKNVKIRLGSDVPPGLGLMLFAIPGFRCASLWAIFLEFPPGTQGLRFHN